jgi:NTP pyrophosphatase (non-canonical NTP hydrolase)
VRAFFFAEPQAALYNRKCRSCPTVRAAAITRKPENDLMEIRELTEEMNRFVREKGWYAPDSPKQQTERNLAISMVLEAAEVLELFQWREAGIEKSHLEGELADVTLYLLQLASIAGIDLEKAVLDKLANNRGRTW